MGFRHYNQNQLVLFPHTFEDLISSEHPVRIVNDVLEKINISKLLSAYRKEGNPSYHPVMMLKVMVFAYMENIYSSRKIEKAMRENVLFMWLSNMNIADHNTIARFRSQKLQSAFKDIFTQVVLLLAEEGLITLKQVYTDGTKIEAQANRYTFVWGKSIQTNKEKMLQQLEELWTYAQSIASDEDTDPQPPEFKEISKEKIRQTVENINQKLSGKTTSDKGKTKAKAKLNYIKNNFEKNLEKYELQEEILKERGSYSKTDTDATFMRMKEDHMKNGQLKPAYNAQISTENQFILNYTLHQNPTDTTTLVSHLDNFKESYGQEVFSAIESLTADAGYGSEENYQLLEELKIEAFVKYNTFDKEQDEHYQNKHKTFSKEHLHYNREQDFYVCPMGQKMEKTHESTTKTKNGFIQKQSHYQAKNCSGCPLRSRCHQSKENRSIERNHNLERHKELARKRLKSEEGIQKRKKRCCDVEPVFAHLKHNHHFKRFMLKSIKKVEIEFGLHALAHNLRKKVA
ncbi:IS1182 family transposase [Chryseobacterium gambrini]|uniref:IS1182 family transposase n=1 Tax=Chryseobacterium gambrini TaxID=373672 RepID=A0AAJ1VPL4_9FLAO|nr:MULTISPECIES: IS1182 family transposase [Chryseobacterium]MDN4015139.1 IS1182 family transposase [Chryseobacterium gambrini]MDN4032066.1 IS1182 family transposase [Chryseobacterium gambrini]QWA39526.1 IS1182 family transposase [Chryseobacterium sp. ZHDP1]QWA39549.1 IS1182 family transposase [Chryseobacterium sp. ZHDP1]